MILRNSQSARLLDKTIDPIVLDSIDKNHLIDVVKTLSVPRHYLLQNEQNRRTRNWIVSQFEAYGYVVQLQSDYDNILADHAQAAHAPRILIGAHYDSVPTTPGADDNASAVAAMLGVARALSKLSIKPPVLFVAFNCEEDNLAGSRDFTRHYLQRRSHTIEQAHILEMVGYTDTESKQVKPRGLPIRLPERGDFLGLVAKGKANRLINPLLSTARTYIPQLPVLGLKVFCGLDKKFTMLRRSDHAPMWDIGIPSIMWTDTAEFRNPNYHTSGDTPETLDYDFLTRVTKLLLAHVLLNNS